MTRLLHPLLPLLAGILLTAGAARAEPSYETLNRALTDQVVIPAYQQMAVAMADLRHTAPVSTETAPRSPTP